MVIKDCHNLVFASQVSLLTSFSQFASSIFLDSVLQRFEACNASYHIHQHWCLSVTKDCHNPIFASQVFSLTSVWQFASCNFLFYEALELILLTTSFINSVVCWSSKMVTTLFSHRKFLLTSVSLIAASIFLDSILRSFAPYSASFHFIQQNVVCWSSKIVTTLFSHRKFLYWHPFRSSLLAFSWILFYKDLKRVMLLTIFINIDVCWSPKIVTILYSHRKFFRWQVSENLLLAASWILF